MFTVSMSPGRLLTMSRPSAVLHSSTSDYPISNICAEPQNRGLVISYAGLGIMFLLPRIISSAAGITPVFGLVYANTTSMATACEPCKRTFKTEEGLQRHLRDSPRHKENQHCRLCNRWFNRVESLQQHLRDSQAHNNSAAAVTESTTKDTPLDRFFLSFTPFAYDPSLPPATSYSQLRRHMAWPTNSPQRDEALHRYRKALVDEVRVWFGSEDDLASWHTLCRAIGIQELPDTIDACTSVC